ncbi:Uncharacterised protein [Mycobacterium tuberculosis]|nr:Uncharacterised protein [Mycobacterium tuberculosis]COX08605.1 Uncharacterised protein [Mycobacterium tuberculosis]
MRLVLPSTAAATATAMKQMAAIAHPRRNASSAVPCSGLPIKITITATPSTAPSWRVVLTTADEVA